jgi:glyoxylase-like metal-dependent hydrolase (beta-lactamase superfamily II)
MSDLDYITFPVGPLTANCIIVFQKESRRAAVIDPGGDAATIIREIKERDLKVEWIYATHGHFDHIMSAREVKDTCGGKTVIGEDDRFLWEAFAQQAEIFGIPIGWSLG